MNRLLSTVREDRDKAHKDFEDTFGWDPNHWTRYDYLRDLSGYIEVNELTTVTELKFFLMTEKIYFSSEPIPHYLDDLAERLKE